MKKILLGLLIFQGLFCEVALTCSQDGSEGFLPENDLHIPVGHKDAGGITEEEFNTLIDQVESLYSPIVSQFGGKLQVERNWNDGTVNAYAEQIEGIWSLSMFGGLARHKSITKDGFALVLCHELGHHIGGAPTYREGDWASNEGQSDYFATLKCLRRLWLSEDNRSAVEALEVPDLVKTSCQKNWIEEVDQHICIRSSMPGESVARLFFDLSMQERPAQFETPDERVVAVTNHYHPSTQCRLDTYFQGALCEKSFNEDVSQTDETVGTCHRSRGHLTGMRPLCWFKPEEFKFQIM